jgi:GNAT superfamily N-acetyltransferase
LTPASAAAVDRALARRLELAEEMACAVVGEAHRALLPGSNAAVMKVAGGTATFVEPGSPISQCIGCGVTSGVGASDLARIEEFYWTRGNVSQMVVSCAFAPELERMLHARGYQVIEENLGFFRHIAPAPEPEAPRDYSIREVAPPEREHWARMQADLFFPDDKAAGDAFLPTSRLLANARGYRCYLATSDVTGETVAGAAICVVPEGRVACLGGAATLPAHRGRGLQAAMLRRRLADAAAAGCDLAYVSTLPGTGSHRNVERAGFTEAYRRVVMTKAQP